MPPGSGRCQPKLAIHPNGQRVILSVQAKAEFKPYEVWVLENLLPKR